MVSMKGLMGFEAMSLLGIINVNLSHTFQKP